MKKVLIISTSPRKNGNSDLLAQAYAGGATAMMSHSWLSGRRTSSTAAAASPARRRSGVS